MDSLRQVDTEWRYFGIYMARVKSDKSRKKNNRKEKRMSRTRHSLGRVRGDIAYQGSNYFLRAMELSDALIDHRGDPACSLLQKGGEQ